MRDIDGKIAFMWDDGHKETYKIGCSLRTIKHEGKPPIGYYINVKEQRLHREQIEHLMFWLGDVGRYIDKGKDLKEKDKDEKEVVKEAEDSVLSKADRDI